MFRNNFNEIYIQIQEIIASLSREEAHDMQIKRREKVKTFEESRRGSQKCHG
jgi:hypothetical protein